MTDKPKKKSVQTFGRKVSVFSFLSPFIPLTSPSSEKCHSCGFLQRGKGVAQG
jgi:hypothetical protein